MDQELLDWIRKNSKSLTLDDGESVEVVYQGRKIGANPFDPEKEIIFYKMQVSIGGAEMVKIFRSASLKAARFFAGIAEGSKVRMTRHGTGTETKYEYEEVGGTLKVEDEPEEKPGFDGDPAF